MRDRKIKKLMHEMTKPPDSFENFCRENGIVLENKPPQKKKKGIFFKVTVAFASAAVAIALCIGLPFAFKGDGKTNNNAVEPNPPVTPVDPPPVNPDLPTDPIFYGDNEVETVRIELEELTADENLFLPDWNNVPQHGRISRMQPIEKPELVLSYRIQKMWCGIMRDEGPLAFELQYVVKCYEQCLISEEADFETLEFSLESKGCTYSYSLVEQGVKNFAKIYFEKGNYKYYIYIDKIENLTEVNKENIEAFIENVL